MFGGDLVLKRLSYSLKNKYIESKVREKGNHTNQMY